MPRNTKDAPEPELEDFEDADAADRAGITAPRLRRRSRGSDGGERESLIGLIREIPNFMKLLYRLATDDRVSRIDKAIVVATIGYVLMPMDLIPDFIPFLGQLDDLYLLALALNRLLNNAGIEVLLDHWDGDVGALETALAALDQAGSFLPEGIRNILRRRID
jgi:uncharacterized membrane protein YkvA (DUF1232 family)